MSLISYALRGNYKKFLNKLDDIAKETGKSKTWLVFNFVSSFLSTGAGYSDYLNYKFYNNSKQENKEYMTIKNQDEFYEIVSPSKYKTFFTVKNNFLNNFKKYIDRGFFHMGSKEELAKFLKDKECFIYKPVDGLGGHGVRKVYTKDIELDSFYQEVIKQEALLEELIVQHQDMSKFTDKSVNTIRVMTFAYEDYSMIMCAMMRIGDGNHDVDNFHQGGMGALVDIETGKLMGNAVNKDNVWFERHPVSNIKFDGYQLPNWDIVKKTCLEAAKVNKNIHVVGWDVAITKNGCTFVEGNRRPGWDLPQELFQRGRKDMARNCLDYINQKEGTNYKLK